MDCSGELWVECGKVDSGGRLFLRAPIWRSMGVPPGVVGGVPIGVNRGNRIMMGKCITGVVRLDSTTYGVIGRMESSRECHFFASSRLDKPLWVSRYSNDL